MSVTLLQLAPLLEATQAVLDARYDVHRWPAAAAAREAWLAAHAGQVEAVVTGGHLGIETELAQRRDQRRRL